MAPTSPPVSGGRPGVRGVARAATVSRTARGRVAVGGQPDRRLADPVHPAVLLGQRRRAAGPDDRVARPHAAVLGGLEQEGAGRVLGELAVDADRRLGVGEHAAYDRDDATVLERQLGEDLEARPRASPREVGVWRGRGGERGVRVGHRAILAHAVVCRVPASPVEHAPPLPTPLEWARKHGRVSARSQERGAERSVEWDGALTRRGSGGGGGWARRRWRGARARRSRCGPRCGRPRRPGRR